MTLTAAHLKRFKTALAHGVVALLFGLGTGQAMATDINISNKPLDTLEGVPANIILTMDDSGSMAWGYLPDNITNTGTNRWKSHVYNRLYYNPNITYLPGVDKNGASLGNSDFENAWHNGYVRSLGTVELDEDFRPRYRDYRPSTTSVTWVGDGEDAYYYIFDTSKTAADATTCSLAVAAHVNDADNCYTKVQVSDQSGVKRYDPDLTGCSPRDESNSACYTIDERQNFANWYSYYSIRHLLAKSATSRAFSRLSTSVRVGWQELNRLNFVNTILPFDSSHREDFFTWLSTAYTNGSTPLTNAMVRAGEKFKTDPVYRKVPNDSTSEMYSCRQNFHFAFTDGYWNSNSVSLSPANYDNANHALPTDGNSPYGDINYTANATLTADQTPPIFRDGNSNYLGDIALKYWATDLHTTLPDEVPTFITDISTDIDGDGDVDNNDIFWNPANDPADWQHMVNFTVGLGIDGVLTHDAATYKDLMTGAGGTTWPTAGTSGDNHHVDDLWHAAINSRGRFFSARDPAQLLAGFKGVLDAIDDRIGSSSAVATTSSQYQAGTNLFQAIYDPSNWAGDLVAKDVITLAVQWSAASVLAQQIDGTITSPRRIITFDPAANGGGIPFQWADLTTAQQTALNTLGGVVDAQGANRLEYLRGDTGYELKNGGNFRNRNSALGDIVHSDPFFLPPPGAPLFFWPDSMESVAYSTFVASYSGRQNMVLFGGNDGMLHILNANSGREILAYIPSSLYPNLSELTNPSYSHQFYVDQPVNVSDVFYGGSWHTVAIGGLGKGGQGIYALDITNPAAFLETNAANLVLWEFTEADDADLGYTFTKPQMFKMNNGKWMVAFGNGYNNTQADGNPSADGDAQLFLLDIEHGGKGGQGVKIKLSTEVGWAEDPTGTGRANRLTDVVAVDQNQDFKVDILYAGDLFGNLWKFDVSNSNANQWTVVLQGSTPTPLFKAVDENGNPQPITVPPAVQYHDKKNGFMVFVGTGKYLETSDPADTSIQTVYGVWDREESSGITTIDRPSLLEQKIEGSNKTQFTLTNARITTNYGLTWYDGNGLPNNNGANKSYLGWYMDLGDIDNNGDPIPQGERVLDELFVSGDRLEFITLIPSTNPCVGGGESWIFAVNAFTGSRFTNLTPWDYNLDGKYDTADKVDWGGGKVWGSGINLKTPQRFRRTKLLEPGADCQEINLLNNADGSITTVAGSCQGFNYGRRSWRQIQIQ
jgi:type IV pilus assembly protein PilY1